MQPGQQDLYAHLQPIVESYRPIEQLIPSHWKAGDVVVNSVRLHYYRTGGDKPSLLLLHGFGEGGLTWLRVAKELEDDYDIVMPDARGHGRSEGIGKGYSTALLVEDPAGLIRSLGLDRPRIIGFSLGGETGLRLAANQPELVRSLIYEGWSDQAEASGTDLANSPGYQAWYNSWLVWLEQLRTLSHRERMVAALPNTVGSTGGKLWPEEEYVPAVDANAHFDLDLARYSINLWSQREAESQAEALRRVSCPVLIMSHAFSFPAPGTEPTIRELPSDQPNVRKLYFENTGHLIHRVAYEEYMRLVKEFLQAT